MQTWGRYTVFACIERTYLNEVYDAYLPIAADLFRRVHIRKPSAVPEAPRAIVQHARQAVQLAHGNISPILEMSYADGIPLVVSEGVPGRALRSLISRSQGREVGLDVNACLYIAVQILEALSHTHRHAEPGGGLLGLVHRDVRPETVWVGFDGAVRLEGFGFSVHHRMPNHPLPPRLDPPYWSPELAAGRPVDHRSDLFSVGAILYEMLAGGFAWPGATAEERWRSVQSANVAPLSHAVPHLSADLLRAVDSALSVDPERRPPSATVFRDELARLLHRSEPAYGSARLSSAVAMVLGEEADEDRARAAEAVHQLTHLEPGLVIRPPSAPPAPAPPPAIEPVADAPAEMPETRRLPPPPPAPTQDLGSSEAESWRDTAPFSTQHLESSDAFEPFDSASSEDVPVDENVARLDAPARAESRAQNRSVSPPPAIEEPDAAAAMADAFTAVPSDVRAPPSSPISSAVPPAGPAPQPASPSSRPERADTAPAPPGLLRRFGTIAAVFALVGLVAWWVSPPSVRRKASRLARLAVIGRKPGGVLVVESIPPGAELVLDDEETGQMTPVKLEDLESEVTHRLAFRLGGEVVRTTTVSIRARQKQTLRIILNAAVANYRIETIPSEAKVSVGGRPASFTPTSVILPADRETKITVDKLGYVSHSWTLVPAAGEARKLEHTFEKTDELRAAEAEEAAQRKAAGIDAGLPPREAGR